MITATGATAQRDWVNVREPAGFSTIVFDVARERLVAFGDVYGVDRDRTFEWDLAHGWQQRLTAVAPSTRAGHAMVYDEARRRVMVFGGLRDGISGAGGLLADTWEWDGDAWTQRFPAVSPSARWVAGIGFDPVRQRVVLFGGSNSAVLGDTMEWDGNNWSLAAPTVAPSARSNATMAFDPVRRRMLLFGGNTMNGAGGNETWLWDGSQWSRQLPAASPQGIGMAVLDTRRQRVHLAEFGRAADWEWDGRNWIPLAVGAPRPQSFGGIAFDTVSGRVTVSTLAGELWQLFPAGWKAVAAAQVPLAYSCEMATDYTTGHVLAFGWTIDGFASHALDGARWTRLPPSPAADEPRCGDGAVASDMLRQRTVAFGGLDALSRPSDGTWEWNGSRWHAIATARRPAARFAGRMAFAPQSGRLLLFGGATSLNASSLYLDDTWSFDGASWTQLQPLAHPSARADHAMTTSLQRGVIVLFGGRSDAGLEGDTWEWSGTNWQLRAPASTAGPSRREGAAMAEDLGLGRVVLHGGLSDNDTWTWDGLAWTRMLVASPPPIMAQARMATDVVSGRAVLGPGLVLTTDLVMLARSWRLELPANSAATSIGAGCGGSGGALALGSDSPYLGNDAFSLEVRNAPASAPCLIAISPLQQTTSLGAGCTAYLGAPFVAVFATAANAAGVARTSIALQQQLPLLGATFYAQAIAVDPQGPLGGLAVSDARQLTIGR